MAAEINVVNEADVEWSESSHGDRFVTKKKWLGHEAEGELLGCSLYEVPPGKRPFPFHYHTGNEEAMYVLSGEATLRTNEEELPIQAGDYITFPIGEDGAHQVINTSDAPIMYLCFATERDPDIVVYPDSNKLLCASYAPPGLYKMLPADAEVSYWEGE